MCSKPVKKPRFVEESIPSYVEEIKSMMHGFGDVRFPLIESAQMIEKILHIEIDKMLKKTDSYVRMRQGNMISHEDLFILIRKYPSKIEKVLKHLYVKDVSHKLSTGEIDLDLTNLEPDIKCSHLKRVQQCINFLNSVGLTQTFPISLANEPNERLVKEVERVNNMSDDDYLKYSEAKRVSFYTKMQGRLKKFKDWLLIGGVTDFDLSHMACEILNHFAREIVGIIVEKALEIRENRNKCFDSLTPETTRLKLNNREIKVKEEKTQLTYNLNFSGHNYNNENDITQSHPKDKKEIAMEITNLNIPAPESSTIKTNNEKNKKPQFTSKLKLFGKDYDGEKNKSALFLSLSEKETYKISKPLPTPITPEDIQEVLNNRKSQSELLFFSFES